MKLALAALAIVAALAALFFHPPSLRPAVVPSTPPSPSIPGIVTGEGSVRRSPGSARVRPAGVVVYVAGEVRRSGIYTLPADSRAADALARAGGALGDADLVAVNLAAPLVDGDEIAVPKMGAVAGPYRDRGAHAAASHRTRVPAHRGRRRTQAPRPPARIDLNTAGEMELEAVPGVGPALAERIVAYRDLNGRFGSTDELADVSGITPRLQDTLEAFVFVR